MLSNCDSDMWQISVLFLCALDVEPFLFFGVKLIIVFMDLGSSSNRDDIKIISTQVMHKAKEQMDVSLDSGKESWYTFMNRFPFSYRFELESVMIIQAAYEALFLFKKNRLEKEQNNPGKDFNQRVYCMHLRVICEVLIAYYSSDHFRSTIIAEEKKLFEMKLSRRQEFVLATKNETNKEITLTTSKQRRNFILYAAVTSFSKAELANYAENTKDIETFVARFYQQLIELSKEINRLEAIEILRENLKNYVNFEACINPLTQFEMLEILKVVSLPVLIEKKNRLSHTCTLL